MNLEEKFKVCKEKHGYQRVDATYKVNIFLGYDDNGYMSLVITGIAKKQIVKSSKCIDVQIWEKENGEMVLRFSLLDGAYKSMFLMFCQDIIDVCEHAGQESAISVAIKRWKYWKELFGKQAETLLTKEQVKGLIGELLELKNHFLKKYGETAAVASWMGPMLGHKDFEIENTWYEIKAVVENAVQVKISSLEQLTSDIDGHLVIYRLEDTSSVNVHVILLNKLVEEIYRSLTELDNRNLFMSRLETLGYSYDTEYDNYCFLDKGRECYTVNEKFPRLTRNGMDKAIGSASYTLILNGLNEFKEQ